jgi:DNA mismatch endonuclease, patch repair protein
MTDRLSPEARSALMANIRDKDTQPELAVRRLLHRLGYRFHVHHRSLPGSPDLAFTARRKVVFIHGCFWHYHDGCRFAHVPKSRSDYWCTKFDKNRARDERNLSALRESGWESFIVWECQLADRAALAERLLAFLGPPRRIENNLAVLPSVVPN